MLRHNTVKCTLFFTAKIVAISAAHMPHLGWCLAVECICIAYSPEGISASPSATPCCIRHLRYCNQSEVCAAASLVPDSSPCILDTCSPPSLGNIHLRPSWGRRGSLTQGPTFSRRRAAGLLCHRTASILQ